MCVVIKCVYECFWKLIEFDCVCAICFLKKCQVPKVVSKGERKGVGECYVGGPGREHRVVGVG